jgi:peptidoglycan/xylan/chitin deacetylase (PgdA/CDA1 family)
MRARRRRRLAVGAFALVIVATVAIVLSAGSSSSPSPSSGARRHHRAAARATPGTGPTADAGLRARPRGGGSQPVPILMYHVIAPPPSGAPFPGLYVTPSEFAAQMDALKRAGWRAVTLDQVDAYWHRDAQLPAGKPLVLTFDNGYQSQFTQALPVLRGLGWVADENIQLTGLPPSQGGLTRAQVRGLIAAGWELDTQGYSHADLIALSPQQLHYQVVVARGVLQRRYGVPVNWFCYPSGHYDASVISAVKEAGYKGSTTVVPGWAHGRDDSYTLARLRVLGGTSPSQLLAQIASVRTDPAPPPEYSGG